MDHFGAMTWAFLLALITNLVTPSLCRVTTRHSKSSLQSNGAGHQSKPRFQRDVSSPISSDDLQIAMKDFPELSGDSNSLLAIESLRNALTFLPIRNYAYEEEKLNGETFGEELGQIARDSESGGSIVSKRNSGGHSLSIVAPLETLRRVKAYREAVQRIAQQQRQIRDNDQILAEKGKRSRQIYSSR